MGMSHAGTLDAGVPAVRHAPASWPAFGGHDKSASAARSSVKTFGPWHYPRCRPTGRAKVPLGGRHDGDGAGQVSTAPKPSCNLSLRNMTISAPASVPAKVSQYPHERHQQRQTPFGGKRRAASHDEHHGGQWKIAYADFVTAMMAFFLVMWLVSSATETQRAVIANTSARRRSSICRRATACWTAAGR